MLIFKEKLKLVLIILFILAVSLNAKTWTVTNLKDLDDEGNVIAGSLRYMIDNAAAGDKIVFADGLTGTIVLRDYIEINKKLAIVGPGASTITISGNKENDLFYITDPYMSFSSLTFRDAVITEDSGAAIYREVAAPGTFTVSNCVFKNNMAGYDGGAIYSYERESQPNKKHRISKNSKSSQILEEQRTKLEVAMEKKRKEIVEQAEAEEKKEEEKITLEAKDRISKESNHPEQNKKNKRPKRTLKNSTQLVKEEGRIQDTINVNKCTFINNYAGNGSGYGPAICVYGAAQVNVIKSKFTSNTGANNSCIYSDEANIFIQNSTFTHNITPYYGVIYQYDGSTIIKNSTFDKNVSGYGGAICDNTGSSPELRRGESLIIQKSTFSNNVSSYDGGAVNSNSPTCEISDCNFYNNLATSSYYGGAIFWGGEGETPTLQKDREDEFKIFNCAFVKNTAGYGGAIYTENYLPMRITNCLFAKNRAADSYGAVYCYNNNDAILIENCDFFENSAYQYGAIYLYSYNNVTLSQSTFSKNIGYVSHAVGYLGGSGGGDKNRAPDFFISGCTFDSNKATNDGPSAIEIYGYYEIENSTFSNNQCSGNYRGGALYVGNAYIPMRNCTFSANSTKTYYAGAIHLNSGSLNLSNCTVYKNYSGVRGGGIGVQSGSLSMDNTIVAKNSAFLGAPDIYDSESTPSRFQSNGYNLVGDESGASTSWQETDIYGNSEEPVDPLLGKLADNRGPSKTHSLLTNSPARNTGETDLEVDQRGANRVNPDDIGAYDASGSFSNQRAAPPEIYISGNGATIPSGNLVGNTGNDTDFGLIPLGSQVTHTFTIYNLGGQNLTLTGNSIGSAPHIFIAGANAKDFQLTGKPASVLGTQQSTAFSIAFVPTNSGLREAVVVIPNSDPSEPLYVFAIRGYAGETTPDDDDNDSFCGVTGFEFVLVIAILALGRYFFRKQK